MIGCCSFFSLFPNIYIYEEVQVLEHKLGIRCQPLGFSITLCIKLEKYYLTHKDVIRINEIIIAGVLHWLIITVSGHRLLYFYVKFQDIMTVIISGGNKFSALEDYSQTSRGSAQNRLVNWDINRLPIYSL